MADINDIENAYLQTVYGYDEPDAIWGNGEFILYMRAKMGITDANDSNGDPIIGDQLYCVTANGTLPVDQLP